MSNLHNHLVAGKGQDSLQFDPRFGSALSSMFAAAPPEVRSQLQIGSGYRSIQRQAELYKQAIAKYGSEVAARKWVAPPGRSQHNHGYAADLRYASPVAQQWAHQNAGRFGLAFPMKHEDWHIELAGARGQNPSPGAAPAGQPAPPQTPLSSPPAFAPPTRALGETVLASMFMPQQPSREDQEAKAAAEQQRRALLFADPFTQPT